MAGRGLWPPPPQAAQGGFLRLEGACPRPQIRVSSRFCLRSGSRLRPALIIVAALSAPQSHPKGHVAWTLVLSSRNSV